MEVYRSFFGSTSDSFRNEIRVSYSSEVLYDFIRKFILLGVDYMTFSTTSNYYFEALKERNIEKFTLLIKNDEKTTLIFPNGHMITGFQNIIDFHTDWFEDPDWSMEYEMEKIGYALVKVKYQDINQAGEPYVMHYYLNLLFQFMDGKWLLFHDQNTLIPS